MACKVGILEVCVKCMPYCHAWYAALVNGCMHGKSGDLGHSMELSLDMIDPSIAYKHFWRIISSLTTYPPAFD